MAVFVIADLHLSFLENKPMNIFGNNWTNHEEKIQKDWIKKVKENDIVVLPGDFSWATYIENAYLDFEYINKLPGKKLLLKGNHDYWWETLKKMRTYLADNNFKNIDFIYNNAYVTDEYILCGTRGWSQTDDGLDPKLLNREILRLELSLEEARKINEKLDIKKEIVVFMHYPPIIDIKEKDTNEFLKLMNKYNIKRCYYGHLHGTSMENGIEGIVKNIELKLISADKLDFKLEEIK